MTQTTIVKQADFIEGFLSTVKDHTDFKNKPFETVFGLMGPLVLWKINWMLGALGFLGEALGYGPGLIGKYVDDYLRSTRKGGEADLSDSNLQSAAEHAAKQILGQSAIESEGMLAEIFLIKHSLSLHDLVTATYVSRHLRESGVIVRMAAGPGILARLKGMLSVSGMFSRITSALWWLLKKFAVGFAGLGIAGGLLSMMGVKKEKERPEAEKAAPSGEPATVGMQHYANMAGNVESTLIMFLDAAIANFSVSFASTVGEPLKGSERMRRVLQEVAKQNWAKIEDVDRAKSFVAPSPLVLAKMLLPEAKYEPIDKEPAEKRVSKTGPAEAVPKAKPSAKAPAAKPKATDPKAELRGLLKGVLT